MLKVACVMVVCMLVAAPAAEAITCGQVASSVSSCINYLRSGGALPPACCNGIRGLNNAARTTPDRQNVCSCLISASRNLRINYGIAAGLPGKCGVNIPYKISPTTDCSRYISLVY